MDAKATEACTLAGFGLKDPDTAALSASERAIIHKTGLGSEESAGAIEMRL